MRNGYCGDVEPKSFKVGDRIELIAIHAPDPGPIGARGIVEDIISISSTLVDGKIKSIYSKVEVISPNEPGWGDTEIQIVVKWDSQQPEQKSLFWPWDKFKIL